MAAKQQYEFTPESVELLRRNLAALRDEALDQHATEWVTVLSHAVALCWDYREKMQGLPTPDVSPFPNPSILTRRGRGFALPGMEGENVVNSAPRG